LLQLPPPEPPATPVLRLAGPLPKAQPPVPPPVEVIELKLELFPFDPFVTSLKLKLPVAPPPPTVTE
jgi:hypothetical protein